MTYFTSGVWDDTSSTNLIRSRINSIAATTYCGMEHSSTEDSFDQTNKLLTLNNTLPQLKSSSNSTHLTVPKQQTILSNCSYDINQKDQQVNDIELSGNTSQSSNLLY